MPFSRSSKAIDVIINADDLGMSREVDDAIFELMAEQLVTSSTLLANGPNIDQACGRAEEFPKCSFGVHLNITEYRPLTSSGKLGPLLDGSGELVIDKIRHASIDGELRDGIYEEYCAQIEKLMDLNIRISHIDSHHYVHTIPRILPVLKKVQRRYRLRKVRITRNIYGSNERASTAFRWKKSLYNFVLRHYVKSKTTQSFSDFNLFYEMVNSANVKLRSSEVVVHPGNSFYDSAEIDLLKGPWRESLPFPVRLISYHELD
jgi:predicted glycoside hydrolase/deacetylase ChbG (UPF0249 family)